MSGVWRFVQGLVRSVATGLFVCGLCWLLVECAPGNTSELAAVASGSYVAGDTAMGEGERAQLARAVTRRFELQDNAFAQIATQVLRASQLNLGVSWRDGSSVLGGIASAEGMASLILCLCALLLAVLTACLAAPAAARRPTAAASQAALVCAAFALCVPLPWLAMVALETFALGHPLSVAPPGGLTAVGHGILPVLVLAVVPSAVLWSHLREALIDAAQEPWVVALRARGVRESAIWRRHLLRNAMPVVVALIPVLLAYLLAATVVVERVFAINGLGQLVARAALLRDIPVLVGVATTSAILIHGTSRLCDWANARLDPRVGNGAP